ncbi:unnamed protein product [Diamesa serratosioi]
MMLSLVLIFLLVSNTVTCRPSSEKLLQRSPVLEFESNEREDHRVKKCFDDTDLNELCQRCEKITENKTLDVFAMCCANEDEATKYCEDYVYYGIVR